MCPGMLLSYVVQAVYVAYSVTIMADRQEDSNWLVLVLMNVNAAIRNVNAKNALDALPCVPDSRHIHAPFVVFF